MSGFKYISVIFIVILLCVSCKQINNPTPSLVTARTLNVREKPFSESEKVAKLSKGDTVQVTKLAYNDAFALIEFSDSKAYVAVDFIKPVKSKQSFINEILDAFQTEGLLNLLIILLIATWPLIVLFNYILNKIVKVSGDSIFKMSDPNETPILQSYYNRLLNIIFWGISPSPFLRYWVFCSLFIVSVPMMFFVLPVMKQINSPYNTHLEVLGINIQEPALFFFITPFIIVPILFFIVRSSLYLIQGANLFGLIIKPLFSNQSALIKMNSGKDVYTDE